MDTDRIKQRLQSHPHPGPELDAFSTCIAACLDCAQSCVSCADACLSEDDPQPLARCIRLNLDCATICEMAGRILSRQHEPEWQTLRASIELCSKVCDACAYECDLHGGKHTHCQLCADTCRRCQQACNDLLTALA